MKEPALVIMAAGMGSRYGGLKQIDPIDEQRNLIIDFSIYDAINAGFKKIVFIIKQIEADFKERIGNRIGGFTEVEFISRVRELAERISLMALLQSSMQMIITAKLLFK